ncbi:mechanosensitive ion channel [Paenibacillus sp. TRM 82003]|nr:mechanosensitive ion channel [Paenibacillus sp. TRM 82003]
MIALNMNWDGWYGYMNALPNLLLAILVFFVGWVVALAVSRLATTLLKRTDWDNKLFLSADIKTKSQPEAVIGKIVFYILMAFVLILFFNILDLPYIAEPFVVMVTTIAAAVPNILKAGLIFLLAWIVASLLRMLVHRGGHALKVPSLFVKWKLAENEEQARGIVASGARIAFYLVLLLFLPGVLASLNIAAVSEPISAMVAQLLAFVPRLFAAALTLLVGWVVARVVRDIVTNLLRSVGTEKLAERLHLTRVLERTSLSAVLGTIAYVLVLIPVVISALETLSLEGISQPAIDMLHVVVTMLPNVFIAALLVLIGVWVGKQIGLFVGSLLERLGFDSMYAYLGLSSLKAGSLTLSQLVGRIAHILIVFLFVIQALNVVQLQFFVGIFTGIVSYLPQLLSAIVIVGLGMYLGTLAYRLLQGALQESMRVLASVARYAILTVAVFMALVQLNVAAELVHTAFLLILGGIALAFGLAFGLGGREHAAAWLAKWRKPVVGAEEELEE